MRHRKEKKELQAKIQALKKSVPRGDKKRNKEVKAEIAILEQNQNDQHEAEIKELDARTAKENSKPELKEESTLEEPGNHQEEIPDVKPDAPRVSKTKRKREKKALKAKQQAELASKAESEYIYSQRYQEEEKIRKILDGMKLEVKPMISDGNCLYYAIEDQLIGRKTAYNSTELRCLTSDYMLKHREEFLPFLTKPESDECYTNEEFEKYCQEIAETSAWGGQVELTALSHVLQAPIHVIQADMPTVKIGEEYDQAPVLLTYHRHELGLGEHYNSVQSKTNVRDAS